MKDIADIAVIIQARLGSQRVPGKMIAPFANTTLLDIAIEKIKQSRIIPWDNFFLSLYEPELFDIGRNHKAQIFHRSEASANSEGTPMTEIFDWHDQLPFKYVIMINACCPMLSIETIDSFVESYLSSDYDGQFAVIEKKNYFWNTNGELLNAWPEGEAILNTKQVGKVLEAAHTLYAGRMDLLQEGIWMGEWKKNDPVLWSMQEGEALDIDYPWEFRAYEAVYKEQCQKK